MPPPDGHGIGYRTGGLAGGRPGALRLMHPDVGSGSDEATLYRKLT